MLAFALFSSERTILKVKQFAMFLSLINSRK